MDNFITADFIGGIWDGKTYDIPRMKEWKVAIMRPLSMKLIEEKKDEPDFVGYEVAVYRHVMNGIFWLARIEKK